MSVDTKHLHFLGCGIPVFFKYLKSCIAIIFTIFFVYAIFAMINMRKFSNCHDIAWFK